MHLTPVPASRVEAGTAVASPELGSALAFTKSDQEIWAAACAIRKQAFDDTVYLRGIVEFSSHCRQNCLYCGLRRDNTALARYRMSPEAIFASARKVKELGFGTVVLQSGEDPGYPEELVADCVRRIKNELGLAVTLSLGERSNESYARLRAAGADRYLLKIETADAANYARLRPGNSLAARLDRLEALLALGYETGSGLITGLPGDSGETLMRGLRLLAGKGVGMLSLSPFTPHPETPLKNASAGTVAENLLYMAQARILAPDAHIPVTSALGLHEDATRMAALRVANVLMPSLTPEGEREQYAIYPGKNRTAQAPERRAADLARLVQASGFRPGTGPGGVRH